MRYRASRLFSLGEYLTRWFPDAARSGDERVVPCPACGLDAAGRPQAHVNVRRGVWTCKRASCGAKGSARDFVRLHLGATDADVARVMAGEDYASPVAPYDSVKLRRALLGVPPSGRINEAEDLARPPLDYHSLPYDSVLGREAWAYLIGRGVTPDQIVTHRVGVATRGRLAGRVILPVFRGALMVYYQARLMMGGEPKYLNPAAGEMPCAVSEVLFNLDVAELYGRVVLVEGYFDALAELPVGVATFGSYLSVAQLDLLAVACRRRSIDVVVKRDGDGTVSRAAMFAMARQCADAGARSVRVDVPVGDPADRLGLASSSPYSLAALVAARVGA